MKVGELYVALGIQPDASWRRGVQMFRDMHHLAWGMAAVFGVKGLGGALIGFNIGVENAKNQIQGMLALARKTDFNSQLADSKDLYEGIRKAAMELPGETEDYVQMLGYLVQPLAAANTSIQGMIDLTTKAKVVSAGLGEGWQKSARDISEFINFGKYNAMDIFIRRLLGPFDKRFEGLESGRKAAKSMTAAQRRDLIMNALNQPAVAGIIDATKNSTEGRMDKFKDQLKQTLGKIGEGLTKAIGPALEKAGDWMQNHTEQITKFAERLGTVLVGAFNVLAGIIGWLAEHGDVAKSVIVAIGAALGFLAARALMAWLAVLWPVLAGAGVVAGLFYMFEKLQSVIGTLGAALATVFVAKKIWDMVTAMRALKVATAETAAAAAGGGGGKLGTLGRIARAMGMGGGGGGSISSLFMGNGGSMSFGSTGYDAAADARSASASIAPGSFNFGPNGYNAVADMAKAGMVGKLGQVGRAVGGAGMKFKSFLGSAASIVGRASPWIMGAMVASEFLPDSWKSAISGAISSGWDTLKGLVGAGSEEARQAWSDLRMQMMTGSESTWQEYLRQSGDKTTLGLNRALYNSPTYYITVSGDVKSNETVDNIKKLLDEHTRKSLQQAKDMLAKGGE